MNKAEEKDWLSLAPVVVIAIHEQCYTPARWGNQSILTCGVTDHPIRSLATLCMSVNKLSTIPLSHTLPFTLSLCTPPLPDVNNIES